MLVFLLEKESFATSTSGDAQSSEYVTYTGLRAKHLFERCLAYIDPTDRSRLCRRVDLACRAQMWHREAVRIHARAPDGPTTDSIVAVSEERALEELTAYSDRPMRSSYNTVPEDVWRRPIRHTDAYITTTLKSNSGVLLGAIVIFIFSALLWMSGNMPLLMVSSVVVYLNDPKVKRRARQNGLHND